MTKVSEFRIKTTKGKEVLDLTDQAQESVRSDCSIVTIFVAHTTCAVTTADLDPGTDMDLLDAVWKMIPKLKYRHPHNPAHVPAHLASSIIGPSVQVPVKDGKLILGYWQRIILVELDGPKDRNIIVSQF